MTNIIKELIVWATAEKEKAHEDYKFFKELKMEYSTADEGGRFKAFSEMIQKLSLLLNTENENGGKNEASNGGKPM